MAAQTRESELSEHLGELRARLVRSIIYIGAGTIAAWFLYDWIFDLLTGPVQKALTAAHTKFMLTHLAEGFLVRCQVALLAGVILALPLVTFEIWGFVAPALTRDEKRPVKWIAPLAAVLFAGGIGVAYLILTPATRFFLSYVPKGAELRPALSGNVSFIAKMFLAFGLTFEMPIALILLGKLGLVKARMLVSYWRHAVVIIGVIAAVVTPSTDIFSMMAMFVPLVLLYVVSIALVKIVEPK